MMKINNFFKILLLINLTFLFANNNINNNNINNKYIYSYTYLSGENIYKNTLLFKIIKKNKSYILEKNINLIPYFSKKNYSYLKKGIQKENKICKKNLTKIGCKFIKDYNVNKVLVLINYKFFKIQEKINKKMCN